MNARKMVLREEIKNQKDKVKDKENKNKKNW